MVGGDPLDLDREYKLGTHHFHSDGGDGFSMLKSCRFLLKPEESINNHELTSHMISPENELCQAYMASPNLHSHRIAEHEGSKLIAFRPSADRRATMI